MMIFTDCSAQGNPGPTGSDTKIKNPGHHSLPIKLAKAITSCHKSHEGEIEAIKSGAECAFENIGQVNSLFIYSEPQSTIKNIMVQSREPYHNETTTKITNTYNQLSFGTYQINILPSTERYKRKLNC